MVDTVTLTDAERDATLTRVFAGNRGGGEADERPALASAPLVFEAAVSPHDLDADELPEWLTGLAFRDENDALQEIVNLTEAERGAIWNQADLCAWLFYRAPGRKARAAVLGRMAEHLGVSKRTVRRRASLGVTFPPGVRSHERPERLYLEALRAADPLAAIEAALAFGWSVAQLREHIGGVENPLEKRALLDETYEGGAPDMEQVLDLVSAILQDVRTMGGLVSLRVRVDAELLTPEAA